MDSITQIHILWSVGREFGTKSLSIHQPQCIEKFEQEGKLRRIYAAIIVDRDGQKPILIGKGGEKLKQISSEARQDMEKLFGGKVWLETWVKVRGGWADDERALKSLGYP
jgi:GTP-binding protein Era